MTSRSFLLNLILLTSLLSASAVASYPLRQTQSRKNLIAIHWPDVSKLEPEVRDQLLTVQKDLAAIVDNSSATDAALADKYGESGRIYHAYSLALPARECYRNAIVLAPKDFRWPYLLAKIDQQEGHVDDAITWFGKASVLDPEYVATNVNLGNIDLELNSLDKSETSFKKALALDPKNAAALYGLGQVTLSQKRFAESVSYFEKALEQVPAANRIHYSLALAYRGLGNAGKAESHLAQRGTVGVRVNDPLFDQLQDLVEGERVHLIRGRTALEAKRFQDAAAEFRKAITSKPASVAAHLNLGTTLVQLNELDAAVAEFKTVLRLDPENGNARFNLAVILETRNQHREAADELQALLKANPGDSNARFFLAQILLKLDQPAAALTEILRVTQADPDNEGAVLQAATLLAETKQYADAITLLERSHAQYPQKTNTAATLAYLLATSAQLELRDGARAFKLAQDVYAATNLPQYGAIVAMALAEMGRCAEAADWQRKMITQAEQRQEADLAAKLKTDLKLYENLQSCRPAGR